MITVFREVKSAIKTQAGKGSPGQGGPHWPGATAADTWVCLPHSGWWGGGVPKATCFAQTQIPRPRPDPKQVPDRSQFELNNGGGEGPVSCGHQEWVSRKEGQAPPPRWEKQGSWGAQKKARL